VGGRGGGTKRKVPDTHSNWFPEKNKNRERDLDPKLVRGERNGASARGGGLGVIEFKGPILAKDMIRVGGRVGSYRFSNGDIRNRWEFSKCLNREKRDEN